ncbi:MAG: uroporphyrinogen decarboxylase family protein [Anaerolineae bacterium]
MTGRERIEAAFAPEGTPEVAAVICYEDIFIRDHWQALTDAPWWQQFAPDVDTQLALHRQIAMRTGQDWITLPSCGTRAWRAQAALQVRPEGVFLVEQETGREQRLEEPPIGGGLIPEGEFAATDTIEQVDALIAPPPAFDVQRYVGEGRTDLAQAILAGFGAELYPIARVSSPLWSTYGLWGFGGMMSMIATSRDLVRHACERYLAWAVHGVAQAAALGARAVWIEECMLDMISPAAFAELNLPYLQRLIEAIRSHGMRSIYYPTGDPGRKWDLLLASGADALALEEGKKGFAIDIAQVVERVGGRCVVLGNLDAVGVLQDGSEQDLRAEIGRQLEAGRRNGARFVMSIGSPVTPDTPVQRVRLYCDLVHELGRW